MIDKPGWDKSRERFEAWWNREIIDRPLLQVRAPKKDAPSTPRPVPSSFEQQWLDIDLRIQDAEWEMSHTYYGGDLFPYFNTSIGPGTFSLFLGARPNYQSTTVWYEPCVDDIPTAVPPVYDENNYFWKLIQEFSRRGVEHFAGRALVAFPDLIENIDTVSSLMGNDELLFALVDCPEKVHEFQRAVLPLYLRYHQELYEIIKDEHGGSCFTCFDMYGQGRVTKVQCDFSAMISRGMFDEFVLPYLDEQCSALDHTVYHLDGVNALQHLDSLLSIPALDAIQWTPGAGKEGIGEKIWWPMYEKVRAAGKSLMLYYLTPAQAQALVEEFGPEGLNLECNVDSEEEADELVRQSFSWRKQR